MLTFIVQTKPIAIRTETTNTNYFDPRHHELMNMGHIKLSRSWQYMKCKILDV